MAMDAFRGTAFCDDEGHFSVDQRSAFHRWLDGVKGQDLSVTIELRRRSRSHAQLRWLWGVAYPLLADHLGYDAHEHEQLHEDVLTARFGTVAVQPKMPGVPPRIVPKTRTGDLNTHEMSEFMDWLVRWAAQEFGVVIPLPDEWQPARKAS